MKNSSVKKASLRFFTVQVSIFAVAANSMAFAQAIIVGHIAPFTGLASPIAKEVSEGAKVYFDYINSTGGINKRELSLFALDDKYNADEFIKQLDVAAQKKPIALLTPIGSPSLLKLVKDNELGKHDFIVMNAIPGMGLVHNPGHPRLFNMRISDQLQMKKLIEHAALYAPKSITLFYQNIPIGTAALADAKIFAEQAKVTIEAVGIKDDPEAIKQTAAQPNVANAPVVIVVGVPKFTADGIAAVRASNKHGSVYTLSYTPVELVAQLAGKERTRGVGFTQAIPNPTGTVLPIQRDFRVHMQKFAPNAKNPSFFHFEGYLSARTLVEGLKRAGANPTGAKLAETLKAMGRIDMGGFEVDFSKSNSGGTYVDLSVANREGKLNY